VSLRRSTSAVSGHLELLLDHNQLQLVTAGAVYSDGDRYPPAVSIARHLRTFLPAARTVLVLGAGLGSIVQVLRERGCDPRFTLVEKDATVLGWALETLGDADPAKLEPVCRDAESFMAWNERTFDLVFVDVFTGRAVPDFVTAPPFLEQCRDSLAPGGRLALNYITDDKFKWETVRLALAVVFPESDVIGTGNNRILISAPAAVPPRERGP
jgi:spermidine synthase